MLSEHLLISNWHLPFGILIIQLLKLLKFDLFVERSIAPFIDINTTLLKRKHVGERVPAPAPQPPHIISHVVPESSSASINPYTAPSARLQEHDLNTTTHLEKMSARHEEI